MNADGLRRCEIGIACSRFYSEVNSIEEGNGFEEVNYLAKYLA